MQPPPMPHTGHWSELLPSLPSRRPAEMGSDPPGVVTLRSRPYENSTSIGVCPRRCNSRGDHCRAGEDGGQDDRQHASVWSGLRRKHAHAVAQGQAHGLRGALVFLSTWRHSRVAGASGGGRTAAGWGAFGAIGEGRTTPQWSRRGAASDRIPRGGLPTELLRPKATAGRGRWKSCGVAWLSPGGAET